MNEVNHTEFVVYMDRAFKKVAEDMAQCPHLGCDSYITWQEGQYADTVTFHLSKDSCPWCYKMNDEIDRIAMEAE